MYFGGAYSSVGRHPDSGFTNVAARSLVWQEWRCLQADIPCVPSEVVLKDEDNSVCLCRIFSPFHEEQYRRYFNTSW